MTNQDHTQKFFKKLKSKRVKLGRYDQNKPIRKSQLIQIGFEITNIDHSQTNFKEPKSNRVKVGQYSQNKAIRQVQVDTNMP